jgi:hypothetical protein
MLDGDLDHPSKVVVVMAARTDVAGVDSVLGKRGRTLLEFSQKYVPVVMEIADYWSVEPGIADTRNYFGDARGCLSGVDSNPDDFGTRAGELDDLLGGGAGIGGIGIGHRLDDHRIAATNQHSIDIDCNGFATRNSDHINFNARAQRRNGLPLR